MEMKKPLTDYERVRRFLYSYAQYLRAWIDCVNYEKKYSDKSSFHTEIEKQIIKKLVRLVRRKR